MDIKRVLTIVASLLLISTTISPVLAENSAIAEYGFGEEQKNAEQQVLQPLTDKMLLDEEGVAQENYHSPSLPILLNELMPRSQSAQGRAACPVVQSDAGSNGDAGNTANTSRSLGTNPNSGQTGTQGCMDANDAEDWYSVTTTAGKDVDVELVVPAGVDFDLYLVDNGGNYVDSSVVQDPLEKVSTSGTSLSGVATTFFIHLSVWSGDGQYTLRTWTNDTPPLPDLTISNVLAPSQGQAGQTVNLNYTVSNQWNASSGSFESQFVLSTDQTLGWGDTAINQSQSESNLAENTSRNMSVQVDIPGNMANGTYYWFVYADGYGNVTEHNESNNEAISATPMLIGESCDDRHPSGLDDAGLGADAPKNTSSVSAPLGNNVTAQFTGCIDGIDANDVFAFDVPANHSIEFEITRHKNSTVSAQATLGQNVVDSGFSFADGILHISSLGSSYDGIGGTYYLNLSRSGDAVDWTMNVWTNYSIPQPDLFISEISGPTNAAAGNPVSIDVIVNNSGTSGAASPLVSVYLSVDDELAEHDIEIGNFSAGFIDVNQSQLVQIQGMIPANLQGGNYSLLAVVDHDEKIAEKNEENNVIVAEDEILIDSKATSCPSQDDAASGGDAGSDMATSFDLGTDSSITITGCLDETVDVDDWYKITITTGLNLSATMVNAPESDFDLFLRDDQGDWFDRPFFGGPSDESVSTIGDPNFEGSGGIFYLSINAYEGLGVYTLIIETEGVDSNAFNCGQQNDLNLGQDAPDTSGAILGDDPTIDGQGCMSGFDNSDSFSFTVTQNSNTAITFDADPSLAFIASIEDQSGNVLSQVDNTTYGSLFATMDGQFEGVVQTYTIIVESKGDSGEYNISISDEGAAPADLSIDYLNCPIDHTSGNEVQVSWQLVNLRGPADGISITVNLDMLNETGGEMMQMLSTNIFVSGHYNSSAFDTRSEFFTTPDELTTGTYSCRLTIDVDDAVVESDENNNVMLGNSFFVQNEEELWANDIDRDGYNSSDSGDGMVDDCPTSYGQSTIDRYGCADVDSDGVSNLNDLWPLDESQALDSDGDGYGDNSEGTDGDYCPEVAGVSNGDDGQGCPIIPKDADLDGVLDQDDLCPNTIVGVNVDEDGCQVDDSTTNNTTNGSSSNTTGNASTGDGSSGQGDSGNEPANGNAGTSEGEGASSKILGLTPTVFGGLVGIIVVLLLILGFSMRGGNKQDDSEKYVNSQFASQDMAYAGYAQQQATAPVPAIVADPTITPEQLAYEQQLVTAGYPADYARQYADQHFRPWLNQR